MIRILYLGLILTVLFSCKNDQKEDSQLAEKKAVSESFAKLLNDYNEEGLKLNPTKATDAGDNRYNDVFPNFLSKEHKEKTKAYYNKYKNALEAIPDSMLSTTEQMSKAVLLWDCTINIDDFKFNKDLMHIDQMWSNNLDFNQYASGTTAQPFKTVEDYNNWLKRVDEYLIWLNSAKENMQKGMSSGYVLPKSLIVKVIPQFESLATGAVEENLYFSPAKNFPEAFSAEDKKALTETYTAMVKDKIIPAHQEMTTFLKEVYLPAGRETSGIADTPLGEAYYQHQIKKYTTTSMTAEEIHQLGLNEVARIRGEMEAVKKQVGFDGDLNAFFDHVRENKKLMP